MSFQPPELCSAAPQESRKVDIPAVNEVPTSSADRPPSTALHLLLIVAATALPFLPSLRYGFVYDDDVQVLQTVAMRSWQPFAEYFGSSVWTLRNSGNSEIALNYNYYRPLFHSWLRVNATLFGVHAFWWHLATLVTHIAVTVLVFFVLRRHFQNSWVATAGSLIFGVHPVHIESVAWVSGVTDPLAALGVLGGLLLWFRKVETRHTALLIASLACYVAALLSKETAIVLVPIIFVSVLIGMGPNENVSQTGRNLLRSAVRETLPFAGITVLYLGVRLAVLHGFRAGAEPWLSHSASLLTAPSAFLFYLRHLLWPVGLRLFYDFSPVLYAGSARFWTPFIFLAVTAWGVLVWWWRQADKAILAAMAWLMLPLLPVLDIGIFFRDDFPHDRYLYLPSIGLAILCGAGVKILWGEKPGSSRRLFSLALLALLVSCLAASTALQSGPWRDNFSLYSHAAEHSQNTMARLNLASEYALRGRLEESRGMLQGVIRERPDFWLVNYNLGYVNYRLRDLDSAEQLLQRSIAENPSDADSHTYLGLVFVRRNRLEDAASQLSEAIARNPRGEGYHFAEGMILLLQGHVEPAKLEFREELKYHPGNGLAQLQITRLENNRAAQAQAPSSH